VRHKASRVLHQALVKNFRAPLFSDAPWIKSFANDLWRTLFCIDLSLTNKRLRSNIERVKLVRAIIKPFKLEGVKDALLAVGVEGMTVTEVKGFGHQKEIADAYHLNEDPLEFLPKISVEVIVADNAVDTTVNAMLKGAKTGKVGDGKILVLPLEQVIRIRTEEQGEAAVR